MKILILEDDPSRIKSFLENLDGAEVTVTTSVDSCTKFLYVEKWDALFLDHDLNGHVYVPSDGEEKTGWHIARFLSENKMFQPKIIVIHTLNEDGAELMKKELPKADYIQHAWERVKFKKNEKEEKLV